jgi:succinate dehydrogenase / fumarate reductase cytochrome b subunit
MSWLIQTLWSSIGKKLMMAVTGLCFCIFLVGHLAGNLTIYAGKDAFDAYAEGLHALGPLLTLIELGLLIFAIIHITTGLTLFYQNLRARPTRNKVTKRGGGRTIASATMPYTGIILLMFVVMHLINFSFVDKSETTIAQIVSQKFENPIYVLIYVATMIIVAFHVRHGFWSAFQTLGANHPKYMTTLMALSIILGLVVGFGFGMLPLYISLFS